MLSEKVTSKWRCKRDNPETFWSNDSPENQENTSKGPVNEYDKLHNKEQCKFYNKLYLRVRKLFPSSDMTLIYKPFNHFMDSDEPLQKQYLVTTCRKGRN